MTVDVFGRKTDIYGGGFAADQAYVSFPDILDSGGQIGLLIQQLTMQYQQQITRLYEVGHEAIYYVGGRTAGEIGIDRIIGPKAISKAFYDKFGDLCQAKGNTLDVALGVGCEGTGNTSADTTGSGGIAKMASYSAHMCVITSIGISVRAENMLINESLRIMTSNLQYKEAPGSMDYGFVGTANI